ncbi:uncharacterized protein LOC141642914 [Silene latifolia]|uniref:uncharacterized protein LOC141642914 n=1 Tax=Silene latifolia TaxID=37657 RepID=UPI003D77468C
MMMQDLTYGVCGGSFEYDYGYGEFEEQVNTNLPYHLYNENPNHYPNFSHQNYHTQYQQQPPTQYPFHNELQLPQYNHLHTCPQQKDEPIQNMILQMMGDQQNFFNQMLEESRKEDNVLKDIVIQREELRIQIAQLKEFQANTHHRSLDIEHKCEFEVVTFDMEDEKWEEPSSLSSCDYESVVFDEEDMRLSKSNTLNLCEYEGVSFDVNIEVLKEELHGDHIYDSREDSNNDDEPRGGIHTITLLEEPILEAFEIPYHEEERPSFIIHEDHLAPIMDPMIIEEDMLDLLQKAKVSYKSYLVKKLKEKIAREATCEDLAPIISTPMVSDHQSHENSPSTHEGLINSNAIVITKIEEEVGKWKSTDENEPYFMLSFNKNHGCIYLKHRESSNAKEKPRKRAFYKPPWPNFIFKLSNPYLCLFGACSQAFNLLLRALSSMDKNLYKLN